MSRLEQWLDRARGRPVDRDLSPYGEALGRIDRRAAEIGIAKASGGEIRDRSMALRERARKGEPAAALIHEAYALAREAAGRTIGLRHFDVQMLGGIALHDQRFVEMQTGEGKTLVAVLPAYLAALRGEGVHVLTFNDYLARRDAEWMRPVYEALGVSVAHVAGGMPAEARRRAYAADVTYLTAKEAGYDTLRDGIARSEGDVVMRPLGAAIVDEADSILIDEARVPLVIAGMDEADEGDDGRRIEIAGLAASMERDVHFRVGEHARNVYLTDEGANLAQERLGCGDLYGAGGDGDLLALVTQALHAAALLERDVDYIVRGGRVEVVDELTGRVAQDRHWPDGLHRAVEAKERLAIRDQGRILGSITMMDLAALYPTLCGMSGTIVPSERELHDFYGRRTAIVPPNRPCIREDLPDLVYTHADAKWAAVAGAVEEARRAGRPVLVGTASVEESERLAGMLRQAGIGCSVLNARNDEEEASIVAEAGAPGAVTVSTNMAGRGTDIRLGGSDGRDRGRVVQAGGLHVIGTSRFASRRIDDQLRGRAGRQGDPGSSRFMVSLEDEMMVRFGLAGRVPRRWRGARRAEPVGDERIGEKIAVTQRIVEGQNLDARRTLFRYSSFVEKQRRAWQARRQEALLAEGDMGRIERLATLHHMDALWEEHLARIASLRDGIHLRRMGGRDPVQEFSREALEMYEAMEEELEARVAETMERAAGAGGHGAAGIEARELRGPSSTWTYLVSDRAHDWKTSLGDMGNVGMGIATGLYFGPIFMAQALYRWIAGKR